MIISGFDDEEPNKEAVIKINKKKSKPENKKNISCEDEEEIYKKKIVPLGARSSEGLRPKKKNINEED